MSTSDFIEIRKDSIANYDYFAVDISGHDITLNGKTFPLGFFTCAIINLTKEYRTELLMLAIELIKAWNMACGDCNDERVEAMRVAIIAIIDKLKNVSPFDCFNIEYSRNIMNLAFAEKQENIPAFVSVYTYLVSDIVNYSNTAINFAQIVTDGDIRTKSELAKCALGYFTDPEVSEFLKAANPIPFTQGLTLRPRATFAPAIPWDEKEDSLDSLRIVRRVYFGRLMDFLVDELFEALAAGHYIRQCKVCGRYFLMTDARRQYYCQTINPEYGVPCSNVAKHRRSRKSIGDIEKQKAHDNPIYVLYKKRSDSIRKDKSKGKYSAKLCDAAQKYARNCYERALIDPEYADNKYVGDMVLQSIYAHVSGGAGV